MNDGVFFPYIFEAPIEKFGVGRKKILWYNVLILPDDFRAELPFEDYPRLRVEGEIADVPIANAFIPTGDGRYYVIVAPNVLRDGAVRLGDMVEMRFRIANQDHVEMPPALESAIHATGEAKIKWRALTAGKKRVLAQHVATAKTSPTKARRVDEAVEALMTYNADLRAWRKANKPPPKR